MSAPRSPAATAATAADDHDDRDTAAWKTVHDLPLWQDLNPSGNAGQFIQKWLERRFLMCPQCERWTSAQITVYHDNGETFSYVHCRLCQDKPLMCFGRELREGEVPMHSSIVDAAHSAGV